MRTVFEEKPRRAGSWRAGCSRPSQRSGVAGAGPWREAANVQDPRTVVSAAVELGTGNELFIRGQGGGLRWDKGQPLASMGRENWVWASAAPQGKLEFQFLLNDQVWARGENVVIEAGQKVQLCPDFEWPEIPDTV